MAQISKIYELKTLGYNQVITELREIDKAFQAIKKSKREASVKFDTDADKARVKALTDELNKEKIKTAELRLERQKLVNEAKAGQNAKQADINQSRKATEQNNAEAGSINFLTQQLKQLNALRRNISPTAGTIQFGGQQLNFAQATAQATALSQQIKQLNGGISFTQAIGSSLNTSLVSTFSKLRSEVGNMIIAYAGWYAAARKVTDLIRENVKLSDSFANLQIRIKGTSEDVDNLFEQLKEIDTRTSLASLVDIANVIAKKGVPKEDIAALTAEFDKLNVVLGTEIGEPSTATANIIKLITIFNDDKSVTAKRVEEIGTALFKLTTTGVATGEFLVNFAERVGAVRGITGLTLPSILGMGAALQQLGQRTEVAGTAAVQLTTRLFTNVQKFAVAAKLSVEDFRNLLRDDPFEALVAVAEGLKSLGDEEIHENFEEVVSAFGEVGVVGVRVKAVLGDIATNGAFVRDRMREAQVSTQDYANQAVSVELKQRTFAATLDRIAKAFESIGTSKAVQVTLAAIASVILLVVTNLGTLLTLLGIYAAAWTIANSAMIAARVATLATNVAMTFSQAIIVLNTTFLRAYTIALGLFTGASTRAASATGLLGIALRLLPIGAIIALIALLAAGCRRLISSVDGSSEALKKQAEQMRISQEITDKANESVADQIVKLESLVRVVTSTITSYDTKRKALEQLISMNDRFSKALQGNVINLNEVQRALKAVKEEILLNARATASASLSAEAYKEVLAATAVRQKAETQLAIGRGTINLGDFSRTQRELLPLGAGPDDSRDPAGDIIIEGTRHNSKKFFDALKKQEEAALQNYQNYLDAQANLDAQVADATNKRAAERQKFDEKTIDQTLKDAEAQTLSIKELQTFIDIIDDKIAGLKEGDKRITEYQKQRDAFQKRLDVLKRTKKRPEREPRPSRVGAEEADDLARIDAELQAALAAEEARFAELQVKTVDRVKQFIRPTLFAEEEFITNIKNINLKYLDEKIARLESEKQLNAKELLTLQQFKRDKVQIELKYLQDIQSLRDKEFDDRRNVLKEELDERIAELREQRDLIDKDPTLTSVDRVQRKLNIDKQILSLQEQFNIEIDRLEKQLNQRSKANSEESARAILRTKLSINQNIRDLDQASLEDIRIAGEKGRAEFTANYEKLRQTIIDNDRLTARQRRIALERLDRLHKFTILSSELAQLEIEFKKIEELYNKGLKSEEEFLKKKAQLEEARTKQRQAKRDLEKEANIFLPSDQGTQDILRDQLSGAFGFEEGSAEDSLLGNVIASAFNAAEEAMNNYFDAERNRIQTNLDLTLKKLDLERDQVRARAQTQQELDAIDKQYAQKKEKAEREAGEKLKKLKRQEARIALATELANIAVAAAANPLNGVTLGAAGIIMYGLLAGLAFARYASNIAAINSTQFRSGGNPDMTTTKGGKVKGRRHEEGGNPFIFKGRVFEDEVDELNIVRTKNVSPNKKYMVSGTQTEIASMLNELGGGVQFKPGAKLHKTFQTGGTLGLTNFPAPVFTPSNIVAADNSNEELRREIRNLAIEQSNRIDRLEVYQVTSSVDEAIRKRVKQTEIGVL